MKYTWIICILLVLSILIIYPKKHNVIYIPNFLSANDFHTLNSNLNSDINTFKNESFRNIKPLDKQKDKIIYDIFYSPKYIRQINLLTENILHKSDFPIEHRIYPTKSEGMKWHIDTLLYDIPQYEAVFTINNSSDSFTQWIDYGFERRWTEPNSLLLVKADSNLHNVTPINNGSREILKLIYTQSDKPIQKYYQELSRFT